ncbi:hypothetical protein JTB14_003111 [Gonioctena quinquepunctata]|nr:hypothetical protein JTB14_003111 [Gonioctena quinquepunctata]
MRHSNPNCSFDKGACVQLLPRKAVPQGRLIDRQFERDRRYYFETSFCSHMFDNSILSVNIQFEVVSSFDVKMKYFQTSAIIGNTFVSIVVLTIIFLAEFGIIPTMKVGFYCKNPALSHRYCGNTVSLIVLCVTTALAPVVAIVITDLVSRQPIKTFFWTLWLFYKEFLIGLAFLLLLGYIVKLLMGEQRPYFFAVCKPNTGKVCKAGEFVETFSCTGRRFSSYSKLNSYHSFPSGHAYTAWFAGIYSSYIIHKRLKTTTFIGSLMKPFLIGVFITWSLTCSLTGIPDKAHHWWDVVAGTILGVSASLYSILLAARALQEYENGQKRKMEEYNFDHRCSCRSRLSTIRESIVPKSSLK